MTASERMRYAQYDDVHDISGSDVLTGSTNAAAIMLCYVMELGLGTLESLFPKAGLRFRDILREVAGELVSRGANIRRMSGRAGSRTVSRISYGGRFALTLLRSAAAFPGSPKW